MIPQPCGEIILDQYDHAYKRYCDATQNISSLIWMTNSRISMRDSTSWRYHDSLSLQWSIRITPNTGGVSLGAPFAVSLHTTSNSLLKRLKDWRLLERLSTLKYEHNSPKVRLRGLNGVLSMGNSSVTPLSGKIVSKPTIFRWTKYTAKIHKIPLYLTDAASYGNEHAETWYIGKRLPFVLPSDAFAKEEFILWSAPHDNNTCLGICHAVHRLAN